LNRAGDDPGGRKLPDDLARLLHDVRGPLNSLTMHLEVLKRTVLGDAIAEDSLRTVHDQLARLTAMLPAAFAVVALEPTETARIDLRAVVDTALERAGGVVEVGAGPWPDVVGDAMLLTLAVVELLRNAVEAGGEPEFQDVFGQRGRYRLMVYGRAGQACRVCGARIRGGRLGGRPTFFCPSCQR